MPYISRFFIFSLIFIYSLFIFPVYQARAILSDEVISLGNTITAGIWEVIEEPDWSAITVSLEVTEEENTYQIKNTLLNTNFEDDLNNWDIGGESKVVLSDLDLNIYPKSGSKMLQINDLGSFSTSLANNFISQRLVFPSLFPQTLSFWYNLVTYENLRGFDEPAFMVYLGDQVIYQVWADDILGESQPPFISGWKQAILRLPSNVFSPTDLTFYAGNMGDDQDTSFVYLDDISTDYLLVNQTTQVSLNIFSEQSLPETLKINYRYFLDGVAVSGTTTPGQTQTTFLFFSQPDDYLFTYWLSDSYGHFSPQITVPVYFDNIAPQKIIDLAAYPETENEVSLVFTAPKDNLFDRVSRYEVRYSDQPINDFTDWQNLPLLVQKNMSQFPGELQSPRLSGQREKLIFDTPTTPNTYYFSIKSIDNSGNYSDLSNIINFIKE